VPVGPLLRTGPASVRLIPLPTVERARAGASMAPETTRRLPARVIDADG